jgi:hypothetical protein
MGSYTGVYEFDYFSDVFAFEDVRHYFRHYLPYSLEV